MIASTTIQQEDCPKDFKLMFAAMIGSMFEFFDFLTFIFLSYIIATLFFPEKMHSLAVFYTFAMITVSYLFRPLGGIIFGNLGDRYGRKFTFVIAILLMAIPSLIIGLVPTYQKAGYISIIIILICRVMQGLSLGGEFPCSIAYISEKFKEKNYFLYCAWLTFGVNVGIAISGQFIIFLIDHTSKNFMYSIGWRIPFIAGGLLGIIGFYIRQYFIESDEFQKLKSNNAIEKLPIRTLIKNYKPQIFCGIWLSTIVSLTTSIFHVFLPTLLINYFNFNSELAFNAGSVGTLTLALFSVIFAALTNYCNPYKIIKTSGILLVSLLIVVLFLNVNLHNISKGHSIIWFYSLIFLVSILLSGINGVFFGILSDLFPVNVRVSGISVCLNTAYIFGAGCTPLWTSAILTLTGNYKYIIAICAIFILSFFSMFRIHLKNY